MIKYGELEYVLDNYCEIGMYDPKSGTDEEIVVMNLFFTEEEAAKDIKIFLDYMPVEIVDVTVDSILDNRKYKIFIELENNRQLFRNVSRILRDCSGLANIEEWKVKVYKSNERTLPVESLEELFKKEKEEYKGIEKREEEDGDDY